MSNRQPVTLRKVITYAIILILAFGNAMSYHLFVFPNRFAPSGLNGLCTIIQELFGLNVGYLSLIINVPLALVVYKLVNRKLAFRSMVYVVTFSALLVILEKVDLSAFAYSTDNGTSTILGPLVAGIISGAVYGILVKCSAYTGGMDYVASLIRLKRPDLNFFYVTFLINVGVATLSYFVYGYQIEPVILCILYSYMSSTVSDGMLKSGRSAIRFEIITDQPEELSRAIIEKLGHSCTLIPAKGMYSGESKNLLICVINKSQIAALSKIIRRHPNSFAIMSSVSEVMGNFKKLNTAGKENKDFLDSGEGSAV
ncbi:MAG: YitT family protein [Oscillospiraceae bacterium]|nr:YitT family protein [Oscillospiraceae bacterium]